MPKKAATSNNKFPFDRLVELIRCSRKVCIVGYELSCESNAPHFNDILNGVWSNLSKNSKIDPFISGNGYSVVLNWFSWRRQLINATKPSKVYQTLRDMKQDDSNFIIATQCVDGLINTQGMSDVYELYGNVIKTRCYESSHEFSIWPDIKENNQKMLCHICGSPIFPNVEMFGWNKKIEVRNALLEQMAVADVLLLLGVDRNLSPFNEMSIEAMSGLPVIELKKNCLLLKEGDFTYTASIGEMEKYIGQPLTAPADLPYYRVLNFLCNIF